jgi:hypothetical protein
VLTKEGVSGSLGPIKMLAAEDNNFELEVEVTNGF